ncbi:MAG: SOS response-associated peptidase [Acidimicrobiales bacterium]
MCGRYVLATPIDELLSFFEARLAPGVRDDYRPSYNVAPTETALGLVEEEEHGRVLDEFRWGLVPSWAKDLSVGSRMFNARAESIATKPSYRAAFEARRLAVIADGFYEWRKDGNGKRQPFYFTRADNEPMAFAGLWEVWRDRSAENRDRSWLRSCTIITTDANKEVSAVHDRMPVVLEQDALELWIGDELSEPDELEGLLRPAEEGTLSFVPVDRRVGRVEYKDPALIAPVAATEG